jgi:hypothetical protein
MTMPLTPSRGGFKRRIQLSHFIRDTLINGDAVPHDIFIAYKTEVQSAPSQEFVRRAYQRIRNSIRKARRSRPHERVKVMPEEVEAAFPVYQQGGSITLGNVTLTWKPHKLTNKKRCISYNGFMHYIYVLKRLGLVESTGQTATAQGKSGSPEGEWHEGHPSETVRAVSGTLGDPAWDNIWQALYPR